MRLSETNWAASKAPPNFDTCAVLSISYILDKPKEEVWAHARKFWHPHTGMSQMQSALVLNELGFQFGRARYDLAFVPTPGAAQSTTLGRLYAKLAREPHTSKFWIGVRNHAIGYTNGKALDTANCSPSTQVLCVYEVVPRGQFQESEDDRMDRVRHTPDQYRLPNLAKALPRDDLPEVVKRGLQHVTIFRVGDPDMTINPGDEVTLVEPESTEGKVISKHVRADEVAWTGTDPTIFYFAPEIEDLDESAAPTRLTPSHLTAAIQETIREWIDNGTVPNVRTIGSGHCYDFAEDVMTRLGLHDDYMWGRGPIEAKHTEDYWASEFSFDIKKLQDAGEPVPTDIPLKEFATRIGAATHEWLYFQGRHYDATAPEGVDHFLDIPFFKNQIEGLRAELGAKRP